MGWDFAWADLARTWQVLIAVVMEALDDGLDSHPVETKCLRNLTDAHPDFREICEGTVPASYNGMYLLPG